MDVLFFGKKGDPFCQKAADYCKQLFPKALVYMGDRSDPFPSDELTLWRGEYIFSYICPWVIPAYVLSGASEGAINWHPGTPDYPGIGCTNFAIYNEETEYGITCHYMVEKVDSGRIIEVKRFKVVAQDTVWSVTQKCYAHILTSFYSIMEHIAIGDALPQSPEMWTREPYTRRQLDALCKLTPDMTEREVHKRIKATTYDRPWAFVEVHGRKLYLKDVFPQTSKPDTHLANTAVHLLKA